MKIGILGAGVSGLSCGFKLREAGFQDITILEKEPVIGGLAASSVIDGYVFDLHGGHVFNSKDEQIKDWVFSLLHRKRWKQQQRIAKILYKGRIINYPFEFSLSELDEDEAIDCLVDFLSPKSPRRPSDYYNWLRWRFGDAIAFKYMIPYNQKIWGNNLRQIGIDWVEGKMPLPSARQIITSVVKKAPEEKDMPHATFYYPLKGGIQTLINAIAKGLGRDIITGYKVERIEKSGKRFVINGEYKFDLVISTICLQDLVSGIAESPSRVRLAAGRLNSCILTTTLCKCSPNNISWLYIPDKDIRTHRLVFQGSFSRFNCPKDAGSSVVLETVGRIDPQAQVKEFNRKQKIPELKAGDIIASSESYAYILYDRSHARNLKIVNEYLDSYGVIRVGRFAERKYYNMDVCMRSAFDAVGRIVNKYGRKKVN